MSQPTGPSPTPSGAAPVEPPRKRRPAWLIPLVAAVALLLLLLLLLSQCTGGDDSTNQDGQAAAGAGDGASNEATSSASPTSPATAPSTATSSPSTSSTTGAAPTTPTSTDGSDGGAGTGGGAGAVLVTGDGASVLGLVGGSSSGGLASVQGQEVSATGVMVESVPADEGFWVGSGDQRVWAQLDGPGESDFTVETGQTLDFTAQVVPNDQGFLDMVDLSADEGADQLRQQGHHLLVDRTSLALAK